MNCIFENTKKQTKRKLSHNIDQDVEDAIETHNEAEIESNTGMYMCVCGCGCVCECVSETNPGKFS